MLPAWIGKYIGIPFVAHGRDISGCDCYGLVRMVLNSEYGKDLPEFAYDYDDPFAHDRIGSLVDRSLPLLAGDRLDAPEPGAVAVVRIANRPCHLGVYAGDGLILHSRDKKNGSALERVDAPFFRGRIEGYYRVR